MYKVQCTVSGGVTGTRTADLKNGKGKVFVVPTKERAQKMADEYNKSMNTPHSTAYFRAKVVKM